ncbi:NADP-dependent isocitrate dehydrogenase [Candidatus Protochlamydia phocaeensis]|uniref:NADP-dependent isocitrate dehydrogenase n=1 Tax=Candidatus Protochlamydia phocaeensis TaxID=1414722 RepID=UPI000839613D|nr:NADP-dependent isocitrate dehydrogenase [Candidatus Protochlamydia phocaeensis]
MAAHLIPITVAEGDGIGPEIMSATLHILTAAGAPLDIKKVEIGEKVYLRGQPSGIDPSTWETIRQSKAFLKAPITTPQGGGFKSLNVTVRTTLGLYANVRPCVAYYPFVETKHPGMNIVIVRENEEDLYTGIEYRQTPDVYQALKTITRPGCEKIIRYAFEYAQMHERKKVTCFTKDNILKLTDGLFHKIFEEIGTDYPHIEKEHWIVDIGAAKLADTPTAFDVIVMPNLYGDILSDVAAQIAGSVGLAGSANIGTSGAMFEAIHGSAPRRAGQNLANPSGLLLAAIQMLVYIEQPAIAALIHNAWLKTLEEGIHTYDIFKEKTSRQKVGTREFAEAVIQRLGQKPDTLPAAHYTTAKRIEHGKPASNRSSIQKTLLGIDVFIQWQEDADKLAGILQDASPSALSLKMISNRGAKVWPEKMPETSCVDSWRCRFISAQGGAQVTHPTIIDLLRALADKGMDITQTEYLFAFDGRPGYTLGQDEQ